MNIKVTGKDLEITDAIRGYITEKADRLYLHANKLEITLPGGKRVTFEAKLPREFEDVFRADK